MNHVLFARGAMNRGKGLAKTRQRREASEGHEEDRAIWKKG